MLWLLRIILLKYVLKGNLVESVFIAKKPETDHSHYYIYFLKVLIVSVRAHFIMYAPGNENNN